MTRYPIYKVEQGGEQHQLAFVSSLIELEGYLTRKYPAVMWRTTSFDTLSSRFTQPAFDDGMAEIFGEDASGSKYHFLVKEVR